MPHLALSMRLETILGTSPWTWAAVTDYQNPIWLLFATVIGVGGTLATTWRPNKTSENKVALDGLTNLVTAHQAELARLSTRVAVLGARVVLLESELRKANLPVPADGGGL